MPRPPNESEPKRRPSIFSDAVAVLGEIETIGTILLIAVTALICCLAAGPSWGIVAPLIALAAFHVAAALRRRRRR